MKPSDARFLFKNARLFNGYDDECPQRMQVLVEDGLIREVVEGPIDPAGARIIDVHGLTLMPGLIDAHVHACASDLNVNRLREQSEAYRTAHAVRMLGHALDCGFTTVRDVGGADFGIAQAISDGLIRAPRFFYVGKMLSMTGGHGDWRRPHEGACSCASVESMGRIADGVDEVIRATREELRRGAHCIKIMASGGTASPTDPVWMNQYREDEIRAVVLETQERRTYTAAHCHPTAAIRRCVELGVRSIEHGTLIDDETADCVAEAGAFVVPTMIIVAALVEQGRELGFPSVSQEKIESIALEATAGLERMRRAGVKVAFGTDLLGSLYTQQCREFTIRSEVFTPLEILRQATSMSADLMMMKGRIGTIAPQAHADIIVVNGDPLQDIGLLAADGRHLKLIMRAGQIVKDELSYGV